MGRLDTGRPIFHIRHRPRGKFEIWAIREKGDYFHRVTHDPVPLSTGPAQLIHPSISVDGKKLFVISAQNRGELLRFDPGSSQFLRSSQGSQHIA